MYNNRGNKFVRGLITTIDNFTNFCLSNIARNSQPTTSSSSSQQRPQPRSEPTQPRPHSSQSQQRLNANQSSSNSVDERTNATSTSNTTENMSASDKKQTEEKVIVIDDLKDPGDIKKLSVRQLKLLLDKNCVDYKGIKEKEMLHEKVTQLWIDHNQSRPTKISSDDSKDPEYDQICKICMEREMDCVLLECGHYFTCVQCGRQLSECPICRQYVSRVVRTFRA